MRYSNIIYNDLVNTDGVALTFFVQGCSHHCDGCFSKNTWDFNGGKELTEETIKELEYVVSNYKYDYLCILGGEPLDNIDVVERVLNICRNSMKIWIYTGYTFDEILKDKKKYNLVNKMDTIVTGRFEKDKYNALLKFKGSSNQIIYNKINKMWNVIDI